MPIKSREQRELPFGEEDDLQRDKSSTKENNVSAEKGRFLALCFDYKKDRRIEQYLTPVEGEEGFFRADNGDVYERDESVDVYRMVVSYELTPELEEIVNELMADKNRHLPHRDAAIELATIFLAQRKSAKLKKPRVERYGPDEGNFR